MNVFIDTNKYFDFYRASDHSLGKINALIGLITKQKIKLVIPKQVLDEFLRDRDLIYKAFIAENFHLINIPGFLHGDNRISTINKKIDKMSSDYKKKFYSTKSKINIAFKKLFDLAEKPLESFSTLQLAHYRTIRRNPPRKDNNSFGDAIIWETLLEHYSDQDLVIISGDGDWSSETDKKIINPFLMQEWFAKNRKKLSLHNNLGDFINQFKEQKVKISEKIIEEERKLDCLRVSTTGIGTTISGLSFSPTNPNTIVGSSISSSGLITTTYQGMSGIVSITPNLNSRFCVSCGKLYTQNDSNTAIRSFCCCQECAPAFSVSKTCDNCGKHYHDSNSSQSVKMRIGNKCGKCENSYGIT